MAITVVQNITFDADCESDNFGKLIIVDQTDYAGEGVDPDDVVGTWTVTFPDGDSAIVAIDPNVSTTNATVSIPLDANGDYMTGTYTFFYSIVVSGVVQPGTYTQSINYDFCPTLELIPGSCTPPCLDVIVNCFCLKITASDDTDYGTPTNITRELTLYPPQSLSLPSVSTSASSLVYDFSHTGGYEVQVNTSVGYLNTTQNVGIAARVKGSIYKNIKCDRDLCSLYNCIKKLFVSLSKKADNLGGWDKLPMEQREEWLRVLSLSELFDHALKCGDYNDADKFYDQIKDLVNCDCGCQEGTEPRLVNPYCGGAPGSGDTVIVAGSGNVTVSSNTVGSTTTYTVGLSSGFLALITSIQSDITAIEGDITTINNTIAALPVKQYYKLYDSATSSALAANTSLQVLKTYTLAEDTLAVVGDSLLITVSYKFGSNVNNKVVRVDYGTQGNIISFIGANALPASAAFGYEFQWRITKISAGNISQEISSKNYILVPTVVKGPAISQASDENASGDVVINAYGQSPVAGTASDVTCTRLTVELFKA
jgi:hypothetical protein